MAENQTVTQINQMDPVLQKHWDQLLHRAGGASQQGYTPYQGQRVAGPTGLQNASWQGIASLGMAGLPEGFLRGEASAAGTLGAMQGMGERGYGDMSGVAGRFAPVGDRAYSDISGSIPGYEDVFQRAGDIRQWTDEGLAEQYMNPYQRNVNDIATRELEKAGARQQTQLGGQAATMGAFGGARHGLMQEDMRSNLRQQIHDTTAMGQRDAYNAGIGAFNQDRNALMAGRGQQLQALGGQTNAANLANQAQLQALQGESNATMGANQLLQSGLGAEMAGANQMAQISGMGQAMNLDLLNAMNNAGQQQRGVEQQFLDQGYQDFANQRDWEKQQIEWMTNILQGLPQIGLTTTAMNRGGQTNPWNAVAGAGITGAQTAQQALG